MFRVRFHGRGGHGVKTASRILGTAAFLYGSQVQDSPVYGAERRGAAIAAFTRIAAEPILERGVMPNPDLIIVADETLLSMPEAGVLVGKETASAVFINSAQRGRILAEQYAIPCPVFTLDLTRMTTEALGRGSALSTSLGTAACALLGFLTERFICDAVRTELTDLHLPADVIARNVDLALRVFSLVPGVSIGPPKADSPVADAPGSPCAGEGSAGAASVMHVPVPVQSSEGAPVIFATGNSAARHTGSWRIFRPAINLDACTHCGICFALCPDGAISLNADNAPIIDYGNCKGCMICRQECPIHCIAEEKEVRAW